MPPVTRRSFLGSLPLWPLAARARLDRWRPGERSPFSLGVASGDPAPDGFVIWTRLAPDPLDGGGMPPVAVVLDWEVAHDERFRTVIRRGTAIARPERAHAVHVEVDGLAARPLVLVSLPRRRRDEPRRPRPHAAGRAGASRPAAVRVRVVPALRAGLLHRLPAHGRRGPAVVFHLGDYIYESAARDGRPAPSPRAPSSSRSRTTATATRSTSSTPTCRRHTPHSRGSSPGTITKSPTTMRARRPRTTTRSRRFCAPARRGLPGLLRAHAAAARGPPAGAGARMFRGCSFGRLASCFVLDTRQYRTDQPCGDNTTWPCAAMNDPRATMLGAQQERWLSDRFRASRARWNLIPQQVMMARVNRRQQGRDRYSMDHWAGYEVERQRLLGLFAAHPDRNPVVLTGDLHSNWVNDLSRRARWSDGGHRVRRHVDLLWRRWPGPAATD